MKNLNLISEVKSLIMFQERVLKNGTPSAYRYSLEKISDMLDFNSIFISNTEEMFTKYNCKEVLNDYLKLLMTYVKNIDFIIKEMMRLNSIDISNESSFEKRMKEESEFVYRYKVNTIKKSNVAKIESSNQISDGIHFLGIKNNSIIDITFEKSLYENIYHDGNTYWKTDGMMMEYLYNHFKVPFVVTKITSKNNKIKKIEFNGDKTAMTNITKYLDSSIIVIRNKFLFINDIKMIMKQFVIKPKRVPNIKHIESLNMLEKDELIEYPLDSFENYLDFLWSGVNNPDTNEISLTLYRIGSNPAIFNILRNAVEKGINVRVNIELEASGEWINKVWMREMINIGIKVFTYKRGIMKVHSKLTLIKFNNGRMVAQIGTGNYHTETSKQYTDLSLITADYSICNQIDSIFNMFENNIDICNLSDNFIVTGVNDTNIDIIINKIDEQSAMGVNGYICFKCNSLSDENIIKHLNRAAAAGCNIDLIVRGICTWVPNCNNVIIRSIVWDKLEHSRVYSFGKHNPVMYIGSLDLVTSKIEKRIETLVKINDPKVHLDICKYLDRYLTDNKNSWIMRKDGKYYKLEE